MRHQQLAQETEVITMDQVVLSTIMIWNHLVVIRNQRDQMIAGISAQMLIIMLEVLNVPKVGTVLSV